MRRRGPRRTGERRASVSAAQAEIYVSTDVETDGPIPGPYSMLSVGSAAYDAAGQLLGTFSANLETLPGAGADADTAAWWLKFPAAWAACRSDLQKPETALPAYAAWLKALPGKPVFVAYPAAFDFMFVYWYLIRFAGESPFSFAALDMKTLAMAALDTPFHETSKRTMPKDWFGPSKHSHIALEDALEQGELFFRMREAARRKA